jgi:hypothetical protein
MPTNYLSLRFADDDDGTGELQARAQASSFGGEGAAYFNVDEIETFAKSLAEYPLTAKCEIRSGFGRSYGQLDQEHLGISIYPIDGRGHIGVQIRMQTKAWPDTRLQSQMAVKLEIVTTYEPLRRFSADLISLVRGAMREATIEGETL